MKLRKSSFDDLFSKIDKLIMATGIQVYSLLVINPWLVINGKIIKPLDDIQLSKGTMKNMLRRIEDIGKETKKFYHQSLNSILWFPWSLPHILIRDIEFQTITPLLVTPSMKL